ncbi:uncharacterized protein LOC142588885 [Dermacentor variabilis]|uniref:uncharacterized protein LOC142588885 n=1 Tax=Dermacentor variabilis TaxID=34621 RepID=UPI003F5B4C29
MNSLTVILLLGFVASASAGATKVCQAQSGVECGKGLGRATLSQGGKPFSTLCMTTLGVLEAGHKFLPTCKNRNGTSVHCKRDDGNHICCECSDITKECEDTVPVACGGGLVRATLFHGGGRYESTCSLKEQS